MSKFSGNPFIGVVFIVAAAFVFPVMDGINKHLATQYPVYEVVWGRYTFHFLILLPLVLARYGLGGLKPQRPWAQAFRSSLLIAASLAFIGAFTFMPLADALALFYVSPLVVVALSRFVLGEQVGPRRWAAVFIGFIGVLIVMRPGFMEVTWGAILAVVSGVLYASYMVANRKLTGTAPPLVAVCFLALMGTVLMTLTAPAYWVTPRLEDLGWMAIAGLIGAVGHFMVIRAAEFAPASLLAPFGYAKIVGTTIVGYVAFGDFPDTWTWCGIAVIIGSGIYISIRERQSVPVERPHTHPT